MSLLYQTSDCYKDQNSVIKVISILKFWTISLIDLLNETNFTLWRKISTVFFKSLLQNNENI